MFEICKYYSSLRTLKQLYFLTHYQAISGIPTPSLFLGPFKRVRYKKNGPDVQICIVGRFTVFNRPPSKFFKPIRTVLMLKLRKYPARLTCQPTPSSACGLVPLIPPKTTVTHSKFKKTYKVVLIYTLFLFSLRKTNEWNGIKLY